MQLTAGTWRYIFPTDGLSVSDMLIELVMI